MSRQFWTDFLNAYMSMPCLWQMKAREYGDRGKRNACYNRLVEICREVEPNANKDFVLKKINSFRTTFRKEHKKVLDSKRSGTRIGYVYAPTLWYYEILLPTADHLLYRKRHATLEDNSRSVVGQEEFMVNEILPSSTSMDSLIPDWPIPQSCATIQWSNTKASTERKIDQTEGLLEDTREKIRNIEEEDEYDVTGKNWSNKLRRIANVSRITSAVAEKLINDIFYEAEMGNLHPGTRILPPQNIPSLQLPQNPASLPPQLK